ncbi:Putative secreted protein [[Actinomadura] parvosata subsp. kistnae]|uniref:CopC domain-containing protein n=1 Tax=[Actinomadura] parvosata subsp. kistnae TaxID=1909395 RepID=A0A1U9ZX02_9ACTN|nr:hypothetical protein [Nonomuraea sp. ATCC 55076]AQZ62486.1 hypothetical protein BKM31_14355 [Nonomuraea sp. ATCC 55076]SPL88727.1 Putative secreted protein [Actinomadura parvosata subsp. kistnae]
MLKRLIPAVLALAAVLAWAAPAWAHGRSGSADVRFAQTIAGMELTVVVRASLRVPAPLQVDVVAHDPGRGGRVELTLRPAGAGGSSAAAAEVREDAPGMYPVLLRAERVGPHELEVRAGGERSVLPFDLLVPAAPPWEVVVYLAFACAALALVVALVAAAQARRGAAGAGAVAFVVATAVAFTAGGLSPWFVPPVPDGAPAVPEGVRPLGKPNAQPLIEVEPRRPGAYAEFRLRVTLFDGSTGRPADDLAEHHGALSHVVVTSQDGTYFRHVHPLRVAPGVHEVRLRAGEAGRHLVYAEFERADAGGQLVSGAFTVGSPPPAAGSARVARPEGKRPEPERPEGARPVLKPARPVAGRPVTLTLDTGRTAVQPWLGMAGHLIVRSRDGGYLGHVHEAASMTAPGERPPDESVARYGPRLRFTFTFPRPGRHLAWIQYVRNYAIVTVPYVIDVEEGSAR